MTPSTHRQAPPASLLARCTAAVLLLLAASLPLAAAHAVPVNLVQNGSFENPGGLAMGTQVTGSNLSNWQLSACQDNCSPYADRVFTFILAPNYGTAGVRDTEDGSTKRFAQGGPGVSPNGGYAITADGDHEQGTLSQTILGLRPGGLYQLTFYQASMQQEGYAGASSLNWRVGFGNDSQFASTMANPSQGFTGWVAQTMYFYAASASEELSFFATSSAGAAPPFLLLDGVSLVDVPEPAAGGLALLGVAGLLLARRIKRPRT